MDLCRPDCGLPSVAVLDVQPGHSRRARAQRPHGSRGPGCGGTPAGWTSDGAFFTSLRLAALGVMVMVMVVTAAGPRGLLERRPTGLLGHAVLAAGRLLEGSRRLR